MKKMKLLQGTFSLQLLSVGRNMGPVVMQVYFMPFVIIPQYKSAWHHTRVTPPQHMLAPRIIWAIEGDSNKWPHVD